MLMPLFSLAGISRSENALHTDGFSFLLCTSSGMQSEYLKIFFGGMCIYIYVKSTQFSRTVTQR